MLCDYTKTFKFSVRGCEAVNLLSIDSGLSVFIEKAFFISFVFKQYKRLFSLISLTLPFQKKNGTWKFTNINSFKLIYSRLYFKQMNFYSGKEHSRTVQVCCSQTLLVGTEKVYLPHILKFIINLTQYVMLMKCINHSFIFIT